MHMCWVQECDSTRIDTSRLIAPWTRSHHVGHHISAHVSPLPQCRGELGLPCAQNKLGVASSLADLPERGPHTVGALIWFDAHIDSPCQRYVAQEMRNRGRPSPERSAWALLLQEEENNMVRSMIAEAELQGLGPPTAIIFDEVWFPPEIKADVSELAKSFRAACGAPVKCQLLDADAVPTGALLRRVRKALMDGDCQLHESQYTPVPGRMMCLPFALRNLLPDNTELARLVHASQNGPYSYKNICDACPGIVFEEMRDSEWTERPGAYIFHEGHRTQSGYGHAVGVQILVGGMVVLFDSAFTRPVTLSFERLAQVTRNIHTLVVFRVEKSSRSDGEPSNKRRLTAKCSPSSSNLHLMAGGLVVYPTVSRCGVCGGPLQNKGAVCEAKVWDGAAWSVMEHGRSRCRKCGASHRLSYVWKKNAKVSIVTREEYADTSGNQVLLVENYMGFRFSYLRQLAIRQFRCATSLLGEAQTILMTYPETDFISDKNLAMHLGSAVMLFHRFADGRFDNLNMDEPIADDDHMYGGPNPGFRTIFAAWEHDSGFSLKSQTRDLVADGNKVLTRKVYGDELDARRAPGGRPRSKVLSRRPASSQSMSKSLSRCASVSSANRVPTPSDPKTRRTEGIYATVDMRTGEIVHMAEMLNSECRAYKDKAVEDIAKHIKIRTHCLDCACHHSDWEGKFCRRCLLDAWHAQKHKCNRALYDPTHAKNTHWVRGCNTSAAEQLWSRTDKLAPMTMNMRRAAFRLFLRRYCAWRNNFVRGSYRSDINPARSRRAALRRGELPYKSPKAKIAKRPSCSPAATKAKKRRGQP